MILRGINVFAHFRPRQGVLQSQRLEYPNKSAEWTSAVANKIPGRRPSAFREKGRSATGGNLPHAQDGRCCALFRRDLFTLLMLKWKVMLFSACFQALVIKSLVTSGIHVTVHFCFMPFCNTGQLTYFLLASWLFKYKLSLFPETNNLYHEQC